MLLYGSWSTSGNWFHLLNHHFVSGFTPLSHYYFCCCLPLVDLGSTNKKQNRIDPIDPTLNFQYSKIPAWKPILWIPECSRFHVH